MGKFLRTLSLVFCMSMLYGMTAFAATLIEKQNFDFDYLEIWIIEEDYF